MLLTLRDVKEKSAAVWPHGTMDDMEVFGARLLSPLPAAAATAAADLDGSDEESLLKTLMAQVQQCDRTWQGRTPTAHLRSPSGPSQARSSSIMGLRCPDCWPVLVWEQSAQSPFCRNEALVCLEAGHGHTRRNTPLQGSVQGFALCAAYPTGGVPGWSFLEFCVVGRSGNPPPPWG